MLMLRIDHSLFCFAIKLHLSKYNPGEMNAIYLYIMLEARPSASSDDGRWRNAILSWSHTHTLSYGNTLAKESIKAILYIYLCLYLWNCYRILCVASERLLGKVLSVYYIVLVCKKQPITVCTHIQWRWMKSYWGCRILLWSLLSI